MEDVIELMHGIVRSNDVLEEYSHALSAAFRDFSYFKLCTCQLGNKLADLCKKTVARARKGLF